VTIVGMADAPDNAGSLVAGRYVIDWGRRRPFGHPVLPAYAATDSSDPASRLMAVQVQPKLPPRPQPLLSFPAPIDGVLMPLAHGPATAPGQPQGYFVISAAPPGPPLDQPQRRRSEAELLRLVLRPAAQALEQLRARGLTHRAIRPDNVFQAGAGQPVVLGMAWAAPPAVHQPAVSEPPYSAMCLPTGRGDGTIADDVYALGVLLLTLSLGRVPLPGLDDDGIVRRKLELGSYAALVGEARLPPVIGDLLRGMLAEDPEHRPSPVLLMEPTAARARRVAARPLRRSQQTLQIGGRPVSNTRMLAYALATEPAAGLPLLQNGAVDHWIRRELGDPGMAMRLDEALGARPPDSGGQKATNAATIMRAVAVLDPLAPLCWDGRAFWPDGLGTALAAADDAEPLVALLTAEAMGAWARLRPERCDSIALQMEARRRRGWLTRPGGEGLERMIYTLNPLLPCGSDLLTGYWVVRLPELLPALERAAQRVERDKMRPLDRHVAAFVARRSEARGPEIPAHAVGVDRALAELGILAALQLRFHPAPLPHLAGWFAAQSEALLSRWKSRERRIAGAERLAAMAETGQLATMLRLIQDPAERAADAREAEAAVAELAQIDAALAGVANGSAARAEQARRWGQELVAGLGVAAAAFALLAAVLG
jgi:hypothetical protein